MRKILSVALSLLLLSGAGYAQNKKGAAKSAEKAKVSYNVKTLKNVDDKDILKTIIADYKGKVVLVDFWATWCPPCRAAMKTIDPMKEEYAKNKKVVFLYITGESSPEATWKEMIVNIAGDHYRLTAAQWKALGQDLGIHAIPCYMVIAKDGTVAYSNIQSGGYPGNDIIKAEIDKALK